ncbi:MULTISPECIES: hypothetical protein [Citrobacter]|uniref:hypothetical protein n=1 Tax=Citrobacter TaxID=544 RepID=UPI001901CCCB|nr:MULTISPECIES: hypothetical protein [Citrobacter]MBJ8402103.1 hypothetical protein [Citrobacter youngae]MBJ9604161.1 hypothetical protein [Citrobacter sp. FDAARGOS_156]
MGSINRVIHNTFQHIRHPIHKEKRHLEARPAPVTQQGAIVADPHILPNAAQPTVTSARHTIHRENGSQSVDFNLHGRNVKLPVKSKANNDDIDGIISMCKKGEEVYRKLITGGDVESTKDNVANLMWYLQARASDKVSVSAGMAKSGPQNFEMGAFSIEDKNYNIESFLRKAGSYSRKSSDLKEFKNAGKEYGSQGLDVNKKDIFLPNGRKTVLFARMPKKSDAVPNGIPGKNMLFIKMEEHGCSRISDKIKHGRVKDDGGVDNRERVSPELNVEYTNICARYKELSIDELLSSAALSTTGGIKNMIEDLSKMESNVKIKLNSESSKDDLEKFLSAVSDMQKKLQLRDNSHLRIGNEIIITDDEPIYFFSKEVLNDNLELQDFFRNYIKGLMNPRLSEDMKDVQSRLNDSTVVVDFMRSLKIKSLHDSISIDKLDESTKKLLRSGITGSEIYNSLLSTVGLERLIKSATVGGKRISQDVTGKLQELLAVENNNDMSLETKVAERENILDGENGVNISYLKNQVIIDEITKFISKSITSVEPDIEQRTEHLSKLSMAIASACDQTTIHPVTGIGFMISGNRDFLNENTSKAKDHINVSVSDRTEFAFTVVPRSCSDSETVVELVGSFSQFTGQIFSNGGMGLPPTGQRIDNNGVSFTLSMIFKMDNATGSITAFVDNAQYKFHDDFKFRACYSVGD